VATTGGALGDAAREADVPVIPLPGILQPRAAVGYMFAAAAEVAAISSVAQAIRTEIDDAAARLEESRDEVAARSAEIAAEIGDSNPVFYGCDLTIPVAYRWKTQANENAKLQAFFHQVPEMDHNEMVGWDGDRDANFHGVFITDSDQHPRKRERIELTAKLIGEAGGSTTIVETQGETRTERLLSAVHLGDLVSLQLAARRGVDPGPVEVLEKLKDELGRP
jgi:glucose/mannose-6-phosphate isomerase